MLPDYFLTLGIWREQAQCAVLFLVATGIAMHLVCTANFMPPTNAPAIIWLPLAMGVSACVVVMHSAWHRDLWLALWGMVAVSMSLLSIQVILWLRGYHVCDHLEDRP